ncbi:proteasome beta subunit [Haladaptatus litoreus]|uniref:Proteasome beta subunit n=1 Tax=Haladaptatus litoreus TaxID=553468 RepID=A0A1N7E4M5_9EURY|nr:20S proteasome subunit A/B [Haladaptatus litoreus]SIR83082.1 proteasome beta subunit [Haladaptatus litoreus]
MATVVGVVCSAGGGVVLAGDRRQTKDGTVVSDSVRRVFDYDFAGCAVVGNPGSIEEFDRQFDAELRTYRTERDEPMSSSRLARTASEIATEAGVDALVAGRDEDGSVVLYEVGTDGRTVETETAALGSGSPVAFGRLENGEMPDDLDAAETLVRETLRAVAERTTDTGSDIDVFRLERTE